MNPYECVNPTATKTFHNNLYINTSDNASTWCPRAMHHQCRGRLSPGIFFASRTNDLDTHLLTQIVDVWNSSATNPLKTFREGLRPASTVWGIGRVWVSVTSPLGAPVQWARVSFCMKDSWLGYAKWLTPPDTNRGCVEQFGPSEKKNIRRLPGGSTACLHGLRDREGMSFCHLHKHEPNMQKQQNCQGFQLFTNKGRSVQTRGKQVNKSHKYAYSTHDACGKGCCTYPAPGSKPGAQLWRVVYCVHSLCGQPGFSMVFLGFNPHPLKWGRLLLQELTKASEVSGAAEPSTWWQTPILRPQLLCHSPSATPEKAVLKSPQVLRSMSFSRIQHIKMVDIIIQITSTGAHWAPITSLWASRNRILPPFHQLVALPRSKPKQH